MYHKPGIDLIFCTVLAFFKLKPWNVAFWAIAPSLYFRYQYKQTEDERVDNLWRIHENREKRDLGPTRSSMGDYDSDEH